MTTADGRATTVLHFDGRAALDAVAWLLAETNLLVAAPNFAGDDRRCTVVLDDWYEASHNEQAVLDTLRVLSTRRYLLDVTSLGQADAQTRWVCLRALAVALDVYPAPRLVSA